MKLEVLADPEVVAKAGARLIAAEAATAVAACGRFTMDVSGGNTPWQMLRALATESMPWAKLHVFQVAKFSYFVF